MKNTKHTQGEWTVNKHPFLNVQSNGQWICQMSDLKSEKKLSYLSDEYEQEEKRLADEQRANAKLIAAAPDLLFALESLMEKCKFIPKETFTDNGKDFQNAINICQHIINKATL